MTDQSENKPYEPVIIGFTCNWCSYRAADFAGTARMKYPANIRLIRLMCSGRIDPSFVFKAFASGADGVMITGCHPGDCHYIEQNYKAMRRFLLMRRMLASMGIDPRRFKLVWASAAEGSQLTNEITNFVEDLRELPKLGWNEWDENSVFFQDILAAQEAVAQEPEHNHEHEQHPDHILGD